METKSALDLKIFFFFFLEQDEKLSPMDDGREQAMVQVKGGHASEGRCGIIKSKYVAQGYIIQYGEYSQYFIVTKNGL